MCCVGDECRISLVLGEVSFMLCTHFRVEKLAGRFFFSTAVQSQENGLSIWRCSRTYVCFGEHQDRDWFWINKKLDRFVHWTQAQMADTADALVSLWDQYIWIYVFSLLKLWTRLVDSIVAENIPVIIMTANWPWTLGESMIHWPLSADTSWPLPDRPVVSVINISLCFSVAGEFWI